MADLKAAAKRLRESAARQKAEMEIWNSPNAASTDYRARLQQAASDQSLAAQALEAWAWMAESGFVLDKHTQQTHHFICYLPFSGKYYFADTPLGAVLAAMEGERNA